MHHCVVSPEWICGVSLAGTLDLAAAAAARHPQVVVITGGAGEKHLKIERERKMKKTLLHLDRDLLCREIYRGQLEHNKLCSEKSDLLLLLFFLRVFCTSSSSSSGSSVFKEESLWLRRRVSSERPTASVTVS